VEKFILNTFLYKIREINTAIDIYLLHTRSYAGHGSNHRVESSGVLYVYGW